MRHPSTWVSKPRCDRCGSTEQVSVTTESSEPSHVGSALCGACIWDVAVRISRRRRASRPYRSPARRS